MTETLGNRIKAARLAAGLSLRGLAEVALGGKKNASLIAAWEAGRVTPSPSSLQKIAPHIRFSASELIDESTIPNSQPTLPQERVPGAAQEEAV